MRHLLVDGKYLELILSGKKTLTIRLSKPKLKPGDLAYLHSKGKIRGIVRIKSVRRKRFEELSEEDAIKDGFSSLEELKEALKEHYGDLSGKYLRLIEFELVQLMERDEGFGDPVEIAREALERLNLSPFERRIAEAVIKAGGIRGAAKMLYGDPLKRQKIRRVLRRLKRKLERGGNLGVGSEGEEHGKREPSQESSEDRTAEAGQKTR